MSIFRLIFKYIWPQVAKFSTLFYLGVGLFTVRVITDNVIRPIYFKKIIDLISVNNIDRFLLREELMHLFLIILSLSLGLLIIGRTSKFVYFKFLIATTKELRDFVLSKVINHSQTFFNNTFSGSLVTKSRRFVNSFESMFDILFWDFYSTILVLIGVFFVLFNSTKQIAFIFLIYVFIYLTIAIVFVKKKMKYDIEEAQSDSKIGGRLADIFGNIFAVKIFSAKKFEVDIFKKITTEASQKSSKAWFFGLRIEIVLLSISIITNLGILYFMISLWLQNSISTGTIVLVQTYMVIVLEKLWSLNNSTMRFMKSIADMKEMIDIFEVKPEILDPQNPEIPKMDKGQLSFNDVSFVYTNGQHVFDKFNLNIKQSERIGIVGHSGAGKSTITNLILRFMDVTEGSITVDGQDIRNIKQDELRKVISYVPQESILFHRSIRDNISYGKPDATLEEVVEVAKKAYAHEFIIRLPKGYDTMVGERGIKLSGGERQRIAIARAMIKDAPILILDEATSSLDSESEKYIQDSFNELMKGKTTIVIAHRLSTIQKMDRIIVLEEGNIIEQGTHQELLANNGRYAELWNHQVGGFIE